LFLLTWFYAPGYFLGAPLMAGWGFHRPTAGEYIRSPGWWQCLQGKTSDAGLRPDAGSRRALRIYNHESTAKQAERAMAVPAMVGHGRDARGTKSIREGSLPRQKGRGIRIQINRRGGMSAHDRTGARLRDRPGEGILDGLSLTQIGNGADQVLGA